MAPPIFDAKPWAVSLLECFGTHLLQLRITHTLIAYSNAECPTESEAGVACLRKLPMGSFIPDPSKPCTFYWHQAAIDGVYIPDDPKTLLETGQYNKDIDVMLGTMQTEGYLLSSLFFAGRFDETKVTSDHVESFIMEDIKRRHPALPEYIRRQGHLPLSSSYLRLVNLKRRGHF